MAKQESKELTKAPAAAVPMVADDYGDMAGVGFENQTSADMSIPFLTVLQAISPEVNGPPAERVKGAAAGMLMNTVTKQLFDGEKGVIIQPCDTNHVFVEWKPRSAGGGFVGIHQVDSDVVKQAIANAKTFGANKVGENDLHETFYIAALLHRSEDLAVQATLGPEPILIAFTSTKIKPYRNIMTRLRTFMAKPPLFAHRLRLSTVVESNNKGTFANFALAPLVDNDIAKSLIP